MATGAIDVWPVYLGADTARLSSLTSLLSDDERRRADRFAFAADRRRFVVARGELRRLLARYLGADARELRFDYGAQGKPALAQATGAASCDLHFNVSHSRDVACYAIARQPVGVDVEYAAPGLAYQELAERFFSPAERVALAGVPVGQRRAVFFACWTRKEAYIKGRGGGLAIPLDSFDVPVDTSHTPRPVVDRGAATGGADWCVAAVTLAPGYAGAVAAPGRDWRPVIRGWPR